MKTQQQLVRELKRKLVATSTPETTENIEDVVASILVAGANTTIVHNDVANTITISSTGGGGGGSGTFLIDDGSASVDGTFTFDDGSA